MNWGLLLLLLFCAILLLTNIYKRRSHGSDSGDREAAGGNSSRDAGDPGEGGGVGHAGISQGAAQGQEGAGVARALLFDQPPGGEEDGGPPAERRGGGGPGAARGGGASAVPGVVPGVRG